MLNFNFAEIISVIVFFLGFYGLLTGKNAIKSIISITIMETSVIVFFLSLGYFEGIKPPIGSNTANAADPLPQALIITAIIIGVAVTATNLTMLISLYRQFKSANWDTIKREHVK